MTACVTRSNPDDHHKAESRFWIYFVEQLIWMGVVSIEIKEYSGFFKVNFQECSCVFGKEFSGILKDFQN